MQASHSKQARTGLPKADNTKPAREDRANSSKHPTGKQVNASKRGQGYLKRTTPSKQVRTGLIQASKNKASKSK